MNMDPSSNNPLSCGAAPDPSDWLEALHDRQNGGGEFDLTQLQPGDLLWVVTRRTVYRLMLLEGRDALLETSRADRPSGRVRIMGCAFGGSSSIKPDRLFCGGSLEFTFHGGNMVHTTTAIRAIRWRHDAPAS
jgi:hypothetical protein